MRFSQDIFDSTDRRIRDPTASQELGCSDQKSKSIRPKISTMSSGKASSASINSAQQAKQASTSEMRRFDKTFTITYGDMAENHVGMQKIGKMAERGFSKTDLDRAAEWFRARGVDARVVALHEVVPLNSKVREWNEFDFASKIDEAYFLLAKGGLNVMMDDCNGADKYFDEQDVLEKDTKAKMYGRVVNKHARHNLCFGTESQEPDYDAGKGRIVAFDDVPHLNGVRMKIAEILGSVGEDLAAEGNYYYDLRNCGIGYHGDSERMKVVGVRIGASMPIAFTWFCRGKQLSEETRFVLDHGDVYMFSEKATGNDWKRKKTIPTLRHAAGCEKYLRIKAEKSEE